MVDRPSLWPEMTPARYQELEQLTAEATRSADRLAEAIRKGLDLHEQDLTVTARAAISRAAAELAALRAPATVVLENALRLWRELGEERPLHIRDLTLVYPELARAWRAQQRRVERIERQRLQLAPEPPELDEQERRAVAEMARQSATFLGGRRQSS